MFPLPSWSFVVFRRLPYRLCLFAFFVSLPFTKGWAFNNKVPFDISADVIDYVDASQTMTADGHVVVVQASSTLTADHLVYDRLQQHLFGRGHVIVHETSS